MSKERLTYVDTAKYIALLLVILSHSNLHGTLLASFLFTFHVPLFFVFSGYTSKNASLGGAKLLLTKRVQRLLVPYFIYAFILGDRPNSLSMVFNIAYGSIQTISQSTASHLWFLPCFFLSIVMYDIIEFIRGKMKSLYWISIPVLFVLSYVTGSSMLGGKLQRGWLWGLNSAFTGCILIHTGRLLRLVINRYFDRIGNRWVLLAISIGILALSILVTMPNLGKHVNIAYANYGVFPLFFITIIMMSVAVLSFAKAVDNHVTAEYGKYTLPIYAFHLLIMGVVTIVMGKIIDVQGFYASIFISFITLIITTVLIIPIKKFAPNIAGVFK